MKVTGIGGFLFRAKDPETLAKWYKEHLGMYDMDENYDAWPQEAGPTVFKPISADNDYFSAQQPFMLNLRVDELEGMVKKLQEGGVKIVKEIENQEGVGTFAWIEDPEGNSIELWQPSDE